MKVYVLTHCAAEENYTPEIYKTLASAKKALQEYYDEYVGNDFVEDVEDDFILSKKLYDTRASIIYTDDTYDEFEIFEVEVQE